jgi:hypothetical protein
MNQESAGEGSPSGQRSQLAQLGDTFSYRTVEGYVTSTLTQDSRERFVMPMFARNIQRICERTVSYLRNSNTSQEEERRLLDWNERRVNELIQSSTPYVGRSEVRRFMFMVGGLFVPHEHVVETSALLATITINVYDYDSETEPDALAFMTESEAITFTTLDIEQQFRPLARPIESIHRMMNVLDEIDDIPEPDPFVERHQEVNEHVERSFDQLYVAPREPVDDPGHILGGEAPVANPVPVEQPIVEVEVLAPVAIGPGEHGETIQAAQVVGVEDQERIREIQVPMYLVDDTIDDYQTCRTAMYEGVCAAGTALYYTGQVKSALASFGLTSLFMYFTPMSLIREYTGSLIGHRPNERVQPAYEIESTVMGQQEFTTLLHNHNHYIGTALDHILPFDWLTGFIHQTNYHHRRGWHRVRVATVYPDVIEHLYRVRPSSTLVDDVHLLPYLISVVESNPDFSGANGYNYFKLRETARFVAQLLLLEQNVDNGTRPSRSIRPPDVTSRTL